MRRLGRVMLGLLLALLLLLGLGLGLAALGRFAALSGGGPLWLDAVASAEAALGSLVLGADYIGKDFFVRGVVLALLSSLCFGLVAALWPRRPRIPPPIYDIEL